ncbi:MAG: 30S ribosomal protein S6 [Candidatus Magasanikbacteria bacterium RIFCSPHIGHO2_01_FULL_47_8]|uniref:Small ribosomal subunit protein bS6 n=1 Tax=Candidatus Magasanikbacteria bacterium RIFCSPHIGHO2_01_FULL_47_8 TaxID=1798673 RepID=A0A1F6MB67_9BACT|nr:MAG: 30S ribosomal protein S6 [Candidatus Magasanikbacteria bacterium RIFCSPHIGHO2_01_FULL_47_8]
MKKYELLLALPGTLDDKEVAARSEEILKLVKEYGEETDMTTMGKNRLAYPIRQIRYGYFYTIVFTATTEKLKILQDKLALMRDVLRAMITHFSTQLTASQKIAYSTDSTGITTMMEKEGALEEKVRVVPVEDKSDKGMAPRPAEKLDLEEINKKLDDLMSGDVAGV